MTRTIRTNAVVGGIATAILGIGLAIGTANHSPANPDTAKAAEVASAVRAPDARQAAVAPQAPEAAPQAAPAPEAKPVEAPKPAKVAGLDETQTNNAKKIVETAKGMGLSDRAAVIAVATAMQESNLHNLASTKLPESYNYTDEGEGSDHDSVGLFQQRQNWGKTKDLMTPETSTQKFLEALEQVPGWDKMPLTVAAQEVQVSAYPDAYAKHEDRATEIVAALNK